MWVRVPPPELQSTPDQELLGGQLSACLRGLGSRHPQSAPPQLRRPLRPIVSGGPRGEPRGAGAQRRDRPGRRSAARRSGRGRHRRRGRRTPTPAQSSRAAFSFMSPAAGQATTAQPLASARTTVPCPPWHTTTSQRGIVARRRPSPPGGRSPAPATAGRAPAGSRSPGPAPARGQPRERGAQQAVVAVLGRRGRHQHQRLVSRRQAPPPPPAAPTAAGRPPAPRRPVPRVLELREGADQAQSAADTAVQLVDARQAQPRPRVAFSSSRPRRRPAHDRSRRVPEPPAGRRARGPRAERVGRMVSRRGGDHVGHDRATGAPSSSAASAGAEREDVARPPPSGAAPATSGARLLRRPHHRP